MTDIEEPQQLVAAENGAKLPTPAPEAIAPQPTGLDDDKGDSGPLDKPALETILDTGAPETMDLTDVTDTTLPRDASNKLDIEPPKEPLGTQEMKKFAQGSKEALDADETEAKPQTYVDEGSSDSDDDSEMMDDSGITLNLEEDPEEGPQVISIDDSSDEESVSKGRSKKPKAPEPFNNNAEGASSQPDVPARSNGAIAVSAGLKLGRAAKAGVAKVVRRPLAESISAGQVQIVDYSDPDQSGANGKNGQELKGISPTSASHGQVRGKPVEVINLVSDPIEPTDKIPDIDARKSAPNASYDGQHDEESDEDGISSDEEDEDSAEDDDEDDDDNIISLDQDEDEEGLASDHESVSSVDTEIWSHQQMYYVKQPLPPFLHEDYRQLFAADLSGPAAAQVTIEKIESLPEPKKRKICDVCMEPHQTSLCDKLKCDICKVSNEHFSFNCPYKSSADKEVSELPIFNVPLGQKDFEIWRIMPPQSRKPIKKASKIPMACYECGDDDHFGDDCPVFGKQRSVVPTTSIWNAKSAAAFTTMNMESKYVRHGKTRMETNDEGEAGWFEARMMAAKTAIPDSNIKRDYLERHRLGAPRSTGNSKPNIQMNLPRSFPGQGSREARSGPTFTRFQGRGNSRPGDRSGGRHDSHHHRSDEYRNRSSSPRRPSFSDQNEYANGRGNHRDRPQDFPRGQGYQPPRGGQDYRAVPPPSLPREPPGTFYGQAGNNNSAGWSLPGSIQQSVQSSNQPPLPPGPPPPLEPPPPPPPHRRDSGRGGGGGGGGYRGGRGSRRRGKR